MAETDVAAASVAASTIVCQPVHRQRWASRRSVDRRRRRGVEPCDSRTMIPGVQKPHWLAPAAQKAARPTRSVVGQAVERGDVAAGHPPRRRHARHPRRAVDQHRAAAALALGAAAVLHRAEPSRSRSTSSSEPPSSGTVDRRRPLTVKATLPVTEPTIGSTAWPPSPVGRSSSAGRGRAGLVLAALRRRRQWHVEHSERRCEHRRQRSEPSPIVCLCASRGRHPSSRQAAAGRGRPRRRGRPAADRQPRPRSTPGARRPTARCRGAVSPRRSPRRGTAECRTTRSSPTSPTAGNYTIVRHGRRHRGAHRRSASSSPSR